MIYVLLFTAFLFTISNLTNATSDITLDELFDRNFLSGNIKINKELLKSICICLCNIEKMEDKTLDDFCNITKYIYSYCQENSLLEVDKNFVNWYITKIYQN
jgi:hypothetical protein